MRGKTASRAFLNKNFAVLGALYDISIPLLVIVSIAAELLALIPFVMATRLTKG